MRAEAKRLDNLGKIESGCVGHKRVIRTLPTPHAKDNAAVDIPWRRNRLPIAWLMA